jgi:hypothetical protein
MRTGLGKRVQFLSELREVERQDGAGQMWRRLWLLGLACLNGVSVCASADPISTTFVPSFTSDKRCRSLTRRVISYILLICLIYTKHVHTHTQEITRGSRLHAAISPAVVGARFFSPSGTRWLVLCSLKDGTILIRLPISISSNNMRDISASFLVSYPFAQRIGKD